MPILLLHYKKLYLIDFSVLLPVLSELDKVYILHPCALVRADE